MTVGDFNEVILPSEVRGGVFHPNRAEKFLNTMDLCGLLDLGAIGNMFTWSRRTMGNILLSKRLDRALACCSWRMMFPEAYVENFCRLHSDHCPMLIRCGGCFASKGGATLPFSGCLDHTPSI